MNCTLKLVCYCPNWYIENMNMDAIRIKRDSTDKRKAWLINSDVEQRLAIEPYEVEHEEECLRAYGMAAETQDTPPIIFLEGDVLPRPGGSRSTRTRRRWRRSGGRGRPRRGERTACRRRSIVRRPPTRTLSG